MSADSRHEVAAPAQMRNQFGSLILWHCFHRMFTDWPGCEVGKSERKQKNPAGLLRSSSRLTPLRRLARKQRVGLPYRGAPFQEDEPDEAGYLLGGRLGKQRELDGSAALDVYAKVYSGGENRENIA